MCWLLAAGPRVPKRQWSWSWSWSPTSGGTKDSCKAFPMAVPRAMHMEFEEYVPGLYFLVRVIWDSMCSRPTHDHIMQSLSLFVPFAGLVGLVSWRGRDAKSAPTTVGVLGLHGVFKYLSPSHLSEGGQRPTDRSPDAAFLGCLCFGSRLWSNRILRYPQHCIGGEMVKLVIQMMQGWMSAQGAGGPRGEDRVWEIVMGTTVI